MYCLVGLDLFFCCNASAPTNYFHHHTTQIIDRRHLCHHSPPLLLMTTVIFPHPPCSMKTTTTMTPSSPPCCPRQWSQRDTVKYLLSLEVDAEDNLPSNLPLFPLMLLLNVEGDMMPVVSFLHNWLKQYCWILCVCELWFGGVRAQILKGGQSIPQHTACVSLEHSQNKFCVCDSQTSCWICHKYT